jgi:pilus assembly protein Flp/PilA
MLQRFFQEETAATAIEYGLIAALIAVVIVAAVGAIGTGLQNTFNTVAAELP